VKKYIKKKAVVTAVQLGKVTLKELLVFTSNVYATDIDFTKHHDGVVMSGRVTTLNGEVFAKAPEYIIKGVEGEVYPCKESVFEKTYEEPKLTIMLKASGVKRHPGPLMMAKVTDTLTELLDCDYVTAEVKGP
jgi:hypothetical protein